MLILGTDPLSRFLNEAKGKPFVWGSWDCLMWLADWIAIRQGDDVAADWRDTYRTPSGAYRILANAGGMVAHMDRCLRPFDIQRTDSPQRGDVVVVDAPEGETGAILLQRKAVRIMPSGLVISEVPIKAAWSI